MLNYGKLLALFVTIASLGFVGFAIATTFGGPDWVNETREDYFQSYKLVRTTTEPPLWAAVRGSDATQLAASRVMPAVLVKVQEDVAKKQKAELDLLKGREPLLKNRNAVLAVAVASDEQALTRYEAEQREQLVQLHKQENDVAGQVVAATSAAQKLENVISALREDVLRLRQQVEEYKADRFRLEEIQRQIENIQAQIQGDLERARARGEMLDQWVH